MKRLDACLAVHAVLMAIAAIPAVGGMATCRLALSGTDARRVENRSGPPLGYIVDVKTPPEIDGKLSDEAWKKAWLLKLDQTMDGGAASQPTGVQVVRCGDTLFLTIRAAEPEMGKIQAALHERDGNVWADDSVEIFLGSGSSYRHFAVNPAGSLYDADGRDAAWNSTAKIAAAKGSKEWTVEMAIPLAELTGKKPAPSELIANFTRNRHAGGANDEFAWSPTGGESHQPDMFGKLVFGEPPAQMATSAAGRGKKLEILRAEGAAGIARFDLSDLPKKTKIYRADLFITRDLGADYAAGAVDIEIFALAQEAKDGKATPSGAPLALRAPFFDRFDATESVNDWVAGKPNGGFLVRTCPNWKPEATRLEIAYEGQAENVPTQATGLRVFHRSGQTFLTWKEVEPPVTTEEITWGEFKKKLAATGDAVRYRIYAHKKQINAENIAEAELIADVGPMSAYNVNGRSPEYLIGQAMIKSDKMGELAESFNGEMFKWHMDSKRMDRYPLDRLVVDEKAGKLPVGTGLYVHNPEKAGKRFYAVVTCRGGVENAKDFSGQNALESAVEETTGAGAPVLQGKGLWGPFFDFPGTRSVYVQWTAPPLSPCPNMYFSWSILVPPGDIKSAPAELFFHNNFFTYAQPGSKLLKESIQIAPHDYPATGWYGFNSAYGTLKSFKAGVVSNHTQKRIIAFLDWAKANLPIDPDRIISVGADGAAALAVNFPDTFAYVWITGFDRTPLAQSGACAPVWGPKSPDIKDDLGRGEWAWADLDKMVMANAAKDMPIFACSGASWGVVPGYARGRGRFYSAMYEARQPLFAGWGWSGGPNLGSVNWYTGVWRGMSIRRDMAVLAFSNSSADCDSESSGRAGGSAYGWRDLKDEPGSFSVVITGAKSTFDLTPRRLKNFKTKPGDKIEWTATPIADAKGKTSGEQMSGGMIVDENGALTVTGLNLDGPGVQLTLAPMTADKLDVDRAELAAVVPARAITEASLKLRNWSDKPRRWKASSDEKWIVPAKSSGEAKGFEDLIIRLDTSSLQPDMSHTGTLAVTDVKANKSYPVKIVVQVGKLFRPLNPQVLNVTAGKESSKEIALANLSGAELAWKVTSGLSWVGVEPASGKTPAKESAVFRLTARAKDNAAGAYQSKMVVSADRNAAKQEVDLTAYVLPEYQKPALPEGETAWLGDPPPAPLKLVSHVSGGKSDKKLVDAMSRTFVDEKTKNKSVLTVEQKTYKKVWQCLPQQETVYSIEGSGFTAFSADAAMPLPLVGVNTNKYCFEIWVDGKLRATTGIVNPRELPRLLVVDNLDKAREIRFVSRREGGENDSEMTVWGDPKLYRKK